MLSFNAFHYPMLRGKVENLISECNYSDWSDIIFTETDLPDFYRKSISLQGAGRLVFEDGAWIRMQSNSEHDVPQLGDIAIAVTSDTIGFINDGHVCGGIFNFTSYQNRNKLKGRFY